ncbi:secondary metabolism biosynthetic enzyme [Penicillium capsulatum]|uniref:Secondary metabolism biosynthetic enzyme n=1 Tax=Penicillium capsulatum TaxID=69766 RepID=A0A9W9IQY3_9EURO|nr:secondary metabolism biosynthetic enzyme [Penicillium capsulatum]KAJ6129819.1 secondary metabolism biosynthetic enzyme [Penicillium capsulatum]
MQAIRLHPAQAPSPPYSPTNPAPVTSLHQDTIPIPRPSKPGELQVRIHGTTIIRDMLTWPETYAKDYAILGHDFAGIVTEVFSETSAFKPGDHVFGMSHADRASTWAEYAIVLESEVALKPARLGWEEAAALPLSAQTAYEALFEHAGVDAPRENPPPPASGKRVLITGAAGGVGMYLVQLAAHAGLRVVAATSSNTRNEEFLRGLGAQEPVEYPALEDVSSKFDIIIDTVGGDLLARCWQYIAPKGTLVSVDSASFDFVEEHRKRGILVEGVKALFFIIRGSSEALHALAGLADRGSLRSFVAQSFPLTRVQEAYEYASGRFPGRGKIVLTV